MTDKRTLSPNGRGPISERELTSRGICVTWGLFWFLCFAEKMLQLAGVPFGVPDHESVLGLMTLIPGLGTSASLDSTAFGVLFAGLVQAALSAVWLREVLRRPGRERLALPAVANVVFFACASAAYVALGTPDKLKTTLVLAAVSLLSVLAGRPAGAGEHAVHGRHLEEA